MARLGNVHQGELKEVVLGKIEEIAQNLESHLDVVLIDVCPNFWSGECCLTVGSVCSCRRKEDALSCAAGAEQTVLVKQVFVEDSQMAIGVIRKIWYDDSAWGPGSWNPRLALGKLEVRR